MNVHFKQAVAGIIALGLVLPGAMILSSPGEASAAEHSTYADSLSAEPVKLSGSETAADVIKNPAQPDIYTLRSDYEITKDGHNIINYQPYVATVGAAATSEEQNKVDKTIKLPQFAGYNKPTDNANDPINNYHIDYQRVVDAAQAGSTTGDTEYGKVHQAKKEYIYKGLPGTITIKHVFQELRKINEYSRKPGTNTDIITTQTGQVGDKPLIKPLPAAEIAGFVPENKEMRVLITQRGRNVEMRYNRAYYAVTFDTQDGTAVPTRTLYYGQEIPAIKSTDIPTRIGAKFLGWKPSVDLHGTLNGTETTFRSNEIIKDSAGTPLKDLNAKLIMPAHHIKFTAVWEEDPTADYAIQFWTEKADHADNAPLLQKYEFVGTHVYRNKATGYRPNLEEEPIKGVEFPDLDKKRLVKIWNGDKFLSGRFLYFNKFYKYNKTLTDSENADPDTPSEVKPVSATGKTVYNIYFDRQVYEVYFTKSNVSSMDSFFPTIWRYNKQSGEPEQVGGSGHPYHFKARFNQRMLDWPNDALQTKGFDEGKQSFGWGPNFLEPNWIYRDTPPYRLSADDFLDMEEYTKYSGYTSQIDAGDGTTIPVNLAANPQTFTTLSFGIVQAGDNGNPSTPHHMDFWMDGFDINPDWQPGMDPKEKYNKIIDYDLYRSKADTNSSSYSHKAPVVQGFTPYDINPGTGIASEDSRPLTENDFDELNEARGEITPYPKEEITDIFGNTDNKGKMHFIKAFFSNADEFGDPLEGDEFEENGYIRFYYKRNQYKLRFNNDPATIKADSEYNASNQKDIFYQKPLQDLNLDNVDTLLDMGLTDLLERDSHGDYQVKRPAGLAPNMVFKGWSLDPAGRKMVSDSKETMPAHNLVLYAKWEEPDYKWKVTFDPAGGTLPPVDAAQLATEQKTIREMTGTHVGKVTYPQKTAAASGATPDDKQVFTVLHRQKLVEPTKPTRDDYSFLGWEVLHYKKDAHGRYTDEIDNSYRQRYIVPELYSFGNEVVDSLYLRAIWVKNDFEKVKVYHHFLDSQYRTDPSVPDNPKIIVLEQERAGQYTMALATQQNEKWLLAQHDELLKTKDQQLKALYTEYNDRLGFENTGFQTFRVQPKQIIENGHPVPNPEYKNNEFHFFYVPFRTRNYKVNYVDERAQAELRTATTEAQKQAIINKYRLIDQEQVSSQARHYDARNYKPIKGWKLTSAPQQQLFYDVEESTNKFLGINGTGSDEITFFYRDVRIIEVPQGGVTPPGYVRVTFKASEGGSFGSDAAGHPITELHYDVLKGTKSSQLPVPQELGGGTRNADKYYITPDAGRNFVNWDKDPLSPVITLDDSSHVFTAQFSAPAPTPPAPTPGPTTPPAPTPNPTTPAPTPNPTTPVPTPNPTTPTTPPTPGPTTPAPSPATPTPGGTPSTPVSPAPSTPSTPATPKPSQPSEPSQPETPAPPRSPENFGKPATPALPGKSLTPSLPPSAPISPDQQHKSNPAKLAATGANSLLYLYAAILFTVTGGLMVRINRRRVRD